MKGIKQPALSRLERGRFTKATLETLKEVGCETAEEKDIRQKQLSGCLQDRILGKSFKVSR